MKHRSLFTGTLVYLYTDALKEPFKGSPNYSNYEGLCGVSWRPLFGLRAPTIVLPSFSHRLPAGLSGSKLGCTHAIGSTVVPLWDYLLES